MCEYARAEVALGKQTELVFSLIPIRVRRQSNQIHASFFSPVCFTSHLMIFSVFVGIRDFFFIGKSVKVTHSEFKIGFFGYFDDFHSIPSFRLQST